jgi:hypothetical protein
VSTVGFPDSTVRERRDRRPRHRQSGFCDCLARSGDERKHFMSAGLKGKKKS